MIDHGCRAPVVALRRVFEHAGVPISEAEARAEMGRAKRDHIRTILALPRVHDAWRTAHGVSPEEADVTALHDAVEPMMRDATRDCATLIPGAADLARRLRDTGIKIASSTGYTRTMMADILPLAAAQGYVPDIVVCAGETLQGLGLREGRRCGRGHRRGQGGGRLDGRPVRVGQRRWPGL
jgi:phosphonoacetaldehyde hydrolase